MRLSAALMATDSIPASASLMANSSQGGVVSPSRPKKGWLLIAKRFLKSIEELYILRLCCGLGKIYS